MVSGPVLKKMIKNKGRKSDCHTFGVNKTKKNENEMKTIDEIGQMLVSGSLDDNKKMRKASADIFAKSGHGKP